VLIADEFKAILIFNAVEAGGGSLPEGALVPGRSEEPGEGVAVLIFKGCHGVRFGDPDEETRPGHPLWRMGFHGEGAFLVVNSTWVAEVKQLNETRPNGRDQRGVDGESPFTTPDWSKVRHYLLSFKDSTFECIAEECVLAARSVSFSHASEIAIKEVGG
jgi:hypothetical protein